MHHPELSRIWREPRDEDENRTAISIEFLGQCEKVLSCERTVMGEEMLALTSHDEHASATHLPMLPKYLGVASA